MEYTSKIDGDRFVMALSGVLSFDDHESFRDVIDQLQAVEQPTIILGLDRLDAIDSAGIGMLLLANDRADRAGKTLHLSGAHGAVQKVISLSQIDRIIPVD